MKLKHKYSKVEILRDMPIILEYFSEFIGECLIKPFLKSV